MSNPQYDIRSRQFLRIGRAHVVVVWRGTRRQQLVGLGDAVHDGVGERGHWRHIGNDGWCFGKTGRGSTAKCNDGGGSNQHWGLLRLVRARDILVML